MNVIIHKRKFRYNRAHTTGLIFYGKKSTILNTKYFDLSEFVDFKVAQ